MAYGYRLNVYKADRRVKSGERFVKSYEYAGYSSNAMQDEIYDLRHRLYPSAAGWRLEYEPLTAVVRSLMTGNPVEIDYRDLNTAQDPSQERYWSI